MPVAYQISRKTDDEGKGINTIVLFLHTTDMNKNFEKHT